VRSTRRHRRRDRGRTEAGSLMLGKARGTMQLDVGFGDVVT
jgi:hypothetical protein